MTENSTSSPHRVLPTLYIWQGVTVVVGFATQAILARSLGPEGKGHLDLFLLIPSVLASLLEFGLVGANTYFGGKGLVQRNVLHGNIIAWSIIAPVVAFGLSRGIESLGIYSTSSLSPTILILSILTVMPIMYFSLWSGLLYGIGATESVYRINGYASIITLAVYGGALLLHVDLRIILILTAVTVFIKFTLAYAATPADARRGPKVSLRQFRSLFSYGFPLYVGLVLNILHSRYVQFYVEDTLGVASLAILALSTRIGEMLWLFDAVLINASLFRITASPTEDSIRITQRLAKAVLILQTGFAVGLAVVSPFIIPLVFGEQFRSSAGVLILLLPGIVAWSVSRALAQFIAYHKGRPVLNTGVAFIGFICNILLVVFLTPMLGVQGAAIASTLSYSTVLVFTVLVFLRVSGTSFVSTFVPRREDVQLAGSILREYLETAGIRRFTKS